MIAGTLDKYIDWKRSYAPTAALCYARWLKRFYETLKTDDFTIDDLQKYVSSLEKKYSVGTRRFIIVVLKDYCRWRKNMRIADVPYELLRKPRGATKHYKPIRRYQFEKMLSCVETRGYYRYKRRDELLLRLLWDTGMRIGEVASLKVEHIDLEDKSAIIKTEKTWKLRKVFWSEKTNELMKLYLQDRKDIKRTSLFFGYCSKNNGNLSMRGLQVIVKKYSKFSGLNITAHCLRTSWATRRYRKGVDLRAISHGLGHSSIKTTQIYIQPEDYEIEQKLRAVF